MSAQPLAPVPSPFCVKPGSAILLTEGTTHHTTIPHWHMNDPGVLMHSAYGEQPPFDTAHSSMSMLHVAPDQPGWHRHWNGSLKQLQHVILASKDPPIHVLGVGRVAAFKTHCLHSRESQVTYVCSQHASLHRLPCHPLLQLHVPGMPTHVPCAHPVLQMACIPQSRQLARHQQTVSHSSPSHPSLHVHVPGWSVQMPFMHPAKHTACNTIT
jgi:hypothetical protein